MQRGRATARLRAVILAAGSLCGQSWDTSKLVIYDPRPMEQVVDLLQAKYGWRITYEDPLVLYPNDIVDVGPAFRRRPTSPPLYAARFGRIDMKGVLPPVLSARDDPAAILQKAIDLHRAVGNVGEFRLLRTGDVFHVVPAKVKDEHGWVVDAASLLDTVITIPEQERLAGQAVSAIVEAVSVGASVTVKSDYMFMRNHQQKVVFGASNEPARSALLRLFDLTGNQTSSWKLLCGAGERHCVLNVHYIQVEVEAPDGSKKRAPLTSPLPQAPPPPAEVVYGLFFKEFVAFQEKADELERQGKSGAAWRARHQEITELSDRQFATVRDIATSCIRDARALDERIAALRGRVPPAPQEILELEQQRKERILAAVEEIRHALGPGAFRYFDMLVRRHVALVWSRPGTLPIPPVPENTDPHYIR